jgi:hypothetical protein
MRASGQSWGGDVRIYELLILGAAMAFAGYLSHRAQDNLKRMQATADAGIQEALRRGDVLAGELHNCESRREDVEMCRAYLGVCIDMVQKLKAVGE